MKSHEVRRLLKISPGTLQTLKSSGILPYTKMGGVHFYDYEENNKYFNLVKLTALKAYLMEFELFYNLFSY